MLGRLILCFASAVALAGCGHDSGEVSAPAGGACAASTFGGNGDAATIGITADASGVYWTDTDGAIWGAGPGGADPHVIATGFGPDLGAIATDGTTIYVVVNEKGVRKINKSGGAIWSVYEGQAAGLAVDDEAIYVATIEDVLRIDKMDGASTPIGAIQYADSIAVDAENVYVHTMAPAGSKSCTFSAPKHGGQATVIACDPLEYHYFSQEIAVDETSIYWVVSSQGTIMKADKKGATVVPLASGIADPVSVTVDDAFVYFTVRGKDGGSLEDRAVSKVPKVGGGAITHLASGGSVSPFGIAVDETRAYWSQKFGGGAIGTACK